MNVDGLLAIQIDQRGQMLNTRNTEAQELLTGLQIPAFLKFVQTRNPEKIGAMFCEKVCLNPIILIDV